MFSIALKCEHPDLFYGVERRLQRFLALTEVFVGGSSSSKDSNVPIATSVMVCAAMLLDAMVNGYGRRVNWWFHAV